MKTYHNLTVRVLAAMLLLAGLQSVWAAPTIISTVPINGANGVSPGASVVFTFSTAMDTTQTIAGFIDDTAGSSPTVVPAWSAGNTVLTCTPSPAFANGHTILWGVSGQDAVGNPLTGTMSGTFTNIAGVNGGSGGNSVSKFAVGKYAYYLQTSVAPPPLVTYQWTGQLTLASNRTATNVTVTLPVSGGVTNLLEDSLQPEKFEYDSFNPSLVNLSNTFPAGNYVFLAKAVASNQQVTVNLPNYAWPNEPVVTNFPATQVVDPSLPFTLGWNTFSNSSSADLILVLSQGPLGNQVFQTPEFGQPNYLSGSSNSVAIPAGTFQANTTNLALLTFYHLTLATNGTTVTYAFVGSVNEFHIITTAASVGPRPFLSIVPSGNNVLLEWPTNSTGYTLEFTNNTPAGAWNTTLPASVVVGTNNVVTTGLSGTQRYFRLIK